MNMMDLSFHSKEDSVLGSQHLHSSVSYEDESSVGEMLTELKKPEEPELMQIVRSVMYKYSKNAHAKFMRVPELCYLLIFFSVHPVAKEFTERKLECKPRAQRQRIIPDINELAKEALILLHDSENLEKSQVYIHLAR